MVPNGYNYHEKSFKKFGFKQSFLQTDTYFQEICPINRVKSRNKTFTTFIPEMKRKVLERIKAYVAVNPYVAGDEERQQQNSFR